MTTTIRNHAGPYVYVPSAVVEKASMHDLVYAACPTCFASLHASRMPASSTAATAVNCPSCGARVLNASIAYKYRLKLQVAYGHCINDAIMFDEVAQTLLGVSATRLQKLQLQYPSLPWILEELLLGLRISFHYQKAEDRAASTSTNGTQRATYNRDLKIVSIAPLSRVLLPKPLVNLAIETLTQAHLESAASSSSSDD